MTPPERAPTSVVGAAIEWRDGAFGPMVAARSPVRTRTIFAPDSQVTTDGLGSPAPQQPSTPWDTARAFLGCRGKGVQPVPPWAVSKFHSPG